MLKKTIYLFTILSVLATMGFGCKGLTAEQQAAIKPVTLNYWTVFNDTGQLAKFAEGYKKILPYVTINIKQVRVDEFEKMFTNALAEDIAPDVVSINARDIRKYQSKLAEMPADIKVSNVTVKGGQFSQQTVVTTETKNMPSAGFVKSSFISTVYNDAVISGKIYGLPIAMDTMAIYYNRDLLDQAGISEPPKTWDDFMKAAKAGTRFNDKGDIIQSGVALGTSKNIPRAFDILSLLMMQSGVKMTQGGYVNFANGVESAGAKHPAVTALRFYTDFAQPTKEVYAWNDKMGDALEAFTRGQAVFYFGFAYDYPKIKSRAPQLNIEVMPMLQLNEKAPANVANYWLETVVKKSKHQNEAWDFVMFMTKPENIKKYCEATIHPTPLRSQINDQKENAAIAPFASQVLNAENWYRGKDSATAEKAFGDLITNYLLSTAGEQKQTDSALLQYAAQVAQQTM